ncbi:MAG: methionine--tRNA ligase subunit beta [Candidatus Harrisonbacteria bacterium CG10_big_fil_rev_8_21_14_0_10_40_38]|uniref:Methionine--tRNA ligase subunit beta n=1 Tax=Candidatus Harrisonbacteria bacterium CG10_big_fil_rev_8_21_14_0_10_40_38 TaxID=1974583 RepID=A0A2H0USQ6_9BACT|nr:MAG: methionine--tRNA ligase subunit beta [Candidatus Harrisonbacteria bacterium CG10_big_fil_rev_8_21_14_0_10_40_38]
METPERKEEKTSSHVSFERWKSLDIRVGKISGAERVLGSEKLIKLAVETGEDEFPSGRCIVAGIGLKYEPENLIGREVTIIANLEPRKLMGIESQGMLLAANDDGPVLLIPEREVPPGSKIS